MDFTLLRLLLALSVVFAHYAEITHTSLGWVHGLTSATAVQAFFVISGWIVTASYETSKSTSAFFVRRVARLYPLYGVVVMIQAIGVLALLGTPPGFLAELGGYLAANLTFANFLKPTFLGFLDGTAVEAINPSLWTLKIEVLFYLSVPLGVWLVRRFGAWALLGMYTGSCLYFYLLHPVSAELAKQLPGQLRYFVAGMAFRVLVVKHYPPEKWNKPLLALVGLAGVYLAQRHDTHYAMAAIQPFFVLALVVAGSVLLPAFKSLPDISFGVYLLHAPLIQFMKSTGVLPMGFGGLWLTLGATVALSIVAYYLIEHPAIQWGQRVSRRLTAQPAPAHTAPTVLPGSA
jgi:peptidoglycan/LPS O-acetylase OafA/YrhL